MFCHLYHVPRQSTAMTTPFTSLTDEQIDRLARRRASAKMGWFIHAAVYIAVNAVLFFIAHNHGGEHRRWSVFPAAGWGVGLLFHGISVWGLGGGLRERLVERERRNLQRQRDGG
jgi:hypothetical protein